MVFIYVVDRDFGFAPNPFHGLCTLATCKPIIRRTALLGDWVVGMGGRRLNATGECIFAMKVTSKITFNEYWERPAFYDKRPIRNGSKKMMVGDNIYSFQNGAWNQLDSHHSQPDGTPNFHNVAKDTQADAVLVSDHFYYFGRASVRIPDAILIGMGYENGRAHRKFELASASGFIEYLESNFPLNRILGDPYDFEHASATYSAENNKITT